MHRRPASAMAVLFPKTSFMNTVVIKRIRGADDLMKSAGYCCILARSLPVFLVPRKSGKERIRLADRRSRLKSEGLKLAGGLKLDITRWPWAAALARMSTWEATGTPEFPPFTGPTAGDHHRLQGGYPQRSSLTSARAGLAGSLT